MTRVAVFDDFSVYADMAAAPLELAGFEVLKMVTEEGPLDWERVVRFAPKAISVGLYRNKDAFDRPIGDWSKDVLGWVPLTQMEQYPAINVVPILLVGSCLQERDVPTTVNYDVFLVLPEDIKRYVPKMRELTTTVKTRRRISNYTCPHCGSHLVYLREPIQELFCPRCYTAVSIIDSKHCIMLLEGTGDSIPCTLEQLAPRDRGGEGAK